MTAAILTTILLTMLLIAIVNAAVWLRLQPGTGQARGAGETEGPFVSLLVPARNEAPTIASTVAGLLAQDYPRFELLILDDHSEDGTAAIAQAAGRGDPRFRLLAGADLPPGWLGKNWACQQLGQAARGDLLVFTDADVRWQPEALAALVRLSERESADLVTIWPTQQTETWAERLAVPLMALVVLAYLPLPLVHHTRFAAFAAANGQCLAFRRRAYDQVGGHAAVRKQIVEDIVFARRIKGQGLRLRMADGNHLIACRMYDGWPSVRDGYAKNILAGYGGHVWALLLAALFHWFVFLGPWLWLAAALGTGGPVLWPAALAALTIAVRGLTAVLSRQRAGDALLMPVSVLLMTAIAARALWWRWRGGPRWKGRVLAGS